MSKIMEKRLKEIAGSDVYSQEIKDAAAIVQKAFVVSDDDPPKEDPPTKTYEDGLSDGKAEVMAGVKSVTDWAVKEAR